ncbi:molybdate transporter subunit; ATP-binding component of ABC superfamily [Rhodospirillaceae bacterium LM-1]|nr:molybdate transporter subunit; ATP-binding component of ABC superfamily [Rhodospirillaceae bacterium LM-1]
MALHIRLRQNAPIPLEASLSCRPGEVLAVFGPSGGGKTTLLRAIAGLFRPQEGLISCNGKVWLDTDKGICLPPQSRRIGFVFQNYALFPHMTALGNVAAAMGHLPSRQRHGEARKLLTRAGLDERLHPRKPAQLSGGQQQRVAIARALARDPEALLLDEPFSALDAALKKELLPFVSRLAHEAGIPVIFVSHAMDEVLQLADAIAILNDGRVAAQGPLEDVLSDIRLKPLTGRYDAGAVMHATIDGHDDKFKLTILRLKGGARLKVGQAQAPIGAEVRLRIHARDVGLALTPPWDISIQNILPGVVVDVQESDGHLADVLLHVGGTEPDAANHGTPLWSQVTRYSVSQLGLKPGSRVYALIKAISIARADLAQIQR